MNHVIFADGVELSVFCAYYQCDDCDGGDCDCDCTCHIGDDNGSD